LTLASTGAVVTGNAFFGYVNGIFIVEGSSADINNNFFNVLPLF
jgi:hypothetical protein